MGYWMQAALMRPRVMLEHVTILKGYLGACHKIHHDDG
jgi:hypothetical protein